MTTQYDRNNLNKVVDRTDELMVVPNIWGLYEQLGIFDKEFLMHKTVAIPRTTYTRNLIGDRNWGERNNNNQSQSRSELTLKVPHFPLDDRITPDDVEDRVAFTDLASNVEVETISRVRVRKMNQMRADHAETLETARAQLIREGTVYAPNGTLATSYGNTINMYTEFGISRTDANVDFVTQGTDPLLDVKAIVDTAQDNLLNGQVVDTYIGIAHPEFFDAMVSHPFVRSSYLYWSRDRGNEVLTGRLTANAFGLDARYETFEYGGILWIKHRGLDSNGDPYMTANEARVFPLSRNGDMFKTYFAPAKRLDTVNTTAQEAYWFEYVDEKMGGIDIMSESNFLNFCRYPASVIRVTNTAA